MFKDMTWLNEPARWEDAGESLTLRTADRSDFWRKTHYGFIRDSGHFLYREVAGDFAVTVTFFGGFNNLYDQAGLMVRTDEKTWLKAGVEYSDGALRLSTVATHGTSDWSLSPCEAGSGKVTLRLTRQGDTIHVQNLDRQGGVGRWSSLRLAHLPMRRTCAVGLMACSPERKDLQVTFTDFSIVPSPGIDLHP